MGSADLSTIAFQLFPQAKKQVLLRIENLQDRMDAGAETKYINLLEYAKSLWQSANCPCEDSLTPPVPVITETTLTGMELIEDAAVMKEALKGKLV